MCCLLRHGDSSSLDEMFAAKSLPVANPEAGLPRAETSTVGRMWNVDSKVGNQAPVHDAHANQRKIVRSLLLACIDRLTLDRNRQKYSQSFNT